MMRLMDTEEARGLIRAAIAKAGSQAAFAKAHGLSAPYVSDALTKDVPSQKILDAIGLERVFGFRRKPKGAADAAE